MERIREVRVGTSKDSGTYKRRQKWTHKDSRGEDRNGQPTLLIVEHIRKGSCHHGQRTRPEQAPEEAAEHYSLKIFAGGDGEAKDGEPKCRNDKRQASSL